MRSGAAAQPVATHDEAKGPAPGTPGRWRLGVLAPELPPVPGGMSRLGHGLLTALRERLDLVVLATRGATAIGETDFRDVLDRSTKTAAKAMREIEVDAWLALNAGLAPLAATTSQPFFCYCHGNDFLAPWLDCAPPWMEVLPRRILRNRRRTMRREHVVRGLQNCRRVFSNSHHTADLLARLDIPRDSLEVAFPGIEKDFFQQTTTPGEKLRLLSVSRLTRWGSRKNLDAVLEAVAELRMEQPVEYRIVGDGDDRARLEERSAALGLSDCVWFEGAVSDARLRDLYASADLFVLVSRASETDVEGFGLVYLEAAAAGVPSLGSRAGGATDAIADGQSGFIVDGTSRTDVLAGIHRFLQEGSDPRTVRQFAERFAWPHRASALVNSIESWR